MQFRVLGETRIYHIYIAQIDLRFTLLKCRSYSMTMVPQRGSARCLPGPMFPSTYVTRFMILVPMFPMFPSPYVAQKCFPVPLLIKLLLITQCLCAQYPCFPYSTVPIFPSPYIPQSLYSPVPIFPSAYVPQTSPPVPMLPSLIPQKYFPFLMFPKHVPQSLCLYFE